MNDFQRRNSRIDRDVFNALVFIIQSDDGQPIGRTVLVNIDTVAVDEASDFRNNPVGYGVIAALCITLVSEGVKGSYDLVCGEVAYSEAAEIVLPELCTRNSWPRYTKYAKPVVLLRAGAVVPARVVDTAMLSPPQ